MALKKDMPMRLGAQQFMRRDIQKELDDAALTNGVRSERLTFMATADMAKKIKTIAALKQMTVSTLLQEMVEKVITLPDYNIETLKEDMLKNL